jgi:hypothetical protein
MAATLINAVFIDDETLVHVSVRFTDNLPAHIKGGVFWNPTGQHYSVAHEGSTHPIEFINDRWFLLLRDGEERFMTCPNLALLREDPEVGWWRETDAQHPNNRALSAPRSALGIEDNTDEPDEEIRSPASYQQQNNATPYTDLAEGIKVMATMTEPVAVNMAFRNEGPLPRSSRHQRDLWGHGQPLRGGPFGGGPPQGEPPGGAPFGGPPGGGPLGGAPFRGPPGGGPPQGGPPQPVALPHAFINRPPTRKPPMVFNRDRSDVQQFMNQWNLYYHVNKFNINLATPYQRVTQCLMYICRPKVNNWVEGQLKWLDDVTNRFHNLINVNDE